MTIDWIVNIKTNKKNTDNDDIEEETDFGYEFLYSIKQS